MTQTDEYELISGYLDGELTGDEQEQVEELLATDPEARLVYDELRALSQTLQAMPRGQIGHDLAEEVLDRAQRELPEVARSATSRSTEEETLLRRIPVFRSKRSVAWAVAAIAAAVLVMVLTPGENTPGPQVAQGPPPLDAAKRVAASADDAPSESENPRDPHALRRRRMTIERERQLAPAQASMRASAPRQRGILVICVNLSPDAMKDRLVERVLQKHDVALTANPPTEHPNDREVIERARRLIAAERLEARAETNLNWVFVETPAVKIALALAELKTRFGEGVRIAVDPAADNPLHKHYLIYSDFQPPTAEEAPRRAMVARSSQVPSSADNAIRKADLLEQRQTRQQAAAFPAEHAQQMVRAAFVLHATGAAE